MTDNRRARPDEDAAMDVHTALNRVECGLGGVREAQILRALLGELDVLAKGAMTALEARDMIHAQQWVERMQRALDNARNQSPDHSAG